MKSCRRLSYKLAKLPPLPKYTPLFVPNFKHTLCKSTDTSKRVCWGDTVEPTDKIKECHLHKESKLKKCACHCQAHKQSEGSSLTMKHLSEYKSGIVPAHCCLCRRLTRRRTCETEQLPWMQQHLVLNQTFNNCTKDSQHPVQCTKLTESAEMTSDICTTTKTEKTQSHEEIVKRSTVCSTPSCYFKKLLTRNQNCSTIPSNYTYEAQHNECSTQTKKPISVDITLSLVPKNKNRSKEKLTETEDEKEHKLEINSADHIEFQDDLQSTQL